MATLQYTPVDEIEKIRSRLQDGFKTGKTKSLEYRKYQLLQLAYLLKENRTRFIEAMRIDLGRPVFESEFYEIASCLGDIAVTVKSLDKWAKPEGVPFDINWFAMKPKTHKVPKGTILIITPFNYPVWLVMQPLMSAIAAGNAVCLKASENAPATTGLWTELMPKYLDPDLVQMVNGGVTETTRLLELQWDHISYTGSGTVGRIVAMAAAKHLTPVTLELGGKSPVVVDASCDIEMTAKRVLLGRFVNAGQTCVSPDYILVVKSVQDKFLAALQKTYKSFVNGDGPTPPGSFSHIITDRAWGRISKLLENTRGKVILGGETDASQKHISLSVITDVPKDDSLMSEEIFGPVMPILPVEDLDEAIHYINSGDRPLAIYVFADDKKIKEKVRNETMSGTMAFNECMIQVGVNGLPFGGTGASGYGYHTGEHGYKSFSHMRAEIDNPKFVDKILWWRYPPYTDANIRAMKRVMRDGLPAKPKGPPSLSSGKSVSWGKWVMVLVAIAAAAAVKKNRS